MWYSFFVKLFIVSITYKINRILGKFFKINIRKKNNSFEDAQQHLIKIAKDHKTSTIFLIATNMGAPVYSKLGFVTETEYLFYKDVLLKDKFVLSDKIVPFQEKHFDQLYQLDKKLSSENRLPQK